MKFTMTQSRTRRAEGQYAVLAVIMCVSLFVVYATSAVFVPNEAVAVGKSIGELYENWVEGTVWYEVFGFSSLDEPIPPDSVYTFLPWEAELV